MSYRVRYEIDVEADTPEQAALLAVEIFALQARQICVKTDSTDLAFPPVMEALDAAGTALGKVDFDGWLECGHCGQVCPQGESRVVSKLGVVGDCCWDERLRTVE